MILSVYMLVLCTHLNIKKYDIVLTLELYIKCNFKSNRYLPNGILYKLDLSLSYFNYPPKMNKNE